MSKTACIYTPSKNVDELFKDLKQYPLLDSYKEKEVRNAFERYQTSHIAESFNSGKVITPSVVDIKNQKVAYRLFTLSNKNTLKDVVDNTLKKLNSKAQLSDEENHLKYNCNLFSQLLNIFIDYNTKNPKEQCLIDAAIINPAYNSSFINSPTFSFSLNENLFTNLTYKNNKLYSIKKENDEESLGREISSLVDSELNKDVITDLSKLISIFNTITLNKLISNFNGITNIENKLFTLLNNEIKNGDIKTLKIEDININNTITTILSSPEAFNNKKLNSEITNLCEELIDYIKTIDIKNFKRVQNFSNKLRVPNSQDFEIGNLITPKDKEHYTQVLCVLFDYYVKAIMTGTNKSMEEVLNLYTPAKIWLLVKKNLINRYNNSINIIKRSNEFKQLNNSAEDKLTDGTSLFYVKYIKTCLDIVNNFNYLVDNSTYLLSYKYGYKVRMKMSLTSLANQLKQNIQKEQGEVNLEDRADADFNPEESYYNSAFIPEELENYSHISEEVRKVISNISKQDLKITEKVKDPAFIFPGIYETLNPVKVHALLLEHLAEMHTQADLLPLLHNLVLAKPEFKPLYDKLTGNSTLQNAFYRDFSRNSRKMVEAKVNPTTGEISFIAANGLNSYVINSRMQTDLADMTTLLNAPYKLFKEDGSLLMDNKEALYTILNNIHSITSKIQYNKLKDNLTNTENNNNRNILRYLKDSKNEDLFKNNQEYESFLNNFICLYKNIGINLDETTINNLLNLINKNHLGFDELILNSNKIIRNITTLFSTDDTKLDANDYNRFVLYDNNSSIFTIIANILSKVDDNSVDNMAKIKNKSYNSRSVPNYLNSVLEKLSEDRLIKNPSNPNELISYSDAYMNAHYKDSFWFFKDNVWRNPILNWIKEPKNADIHKSKLRTTTIQIYNGKEFRDWSEKDFYDLILSAYYTGANKNKKTDLSTLFLAGVFSDNPSFIMHESKIRNENDCLNYYIDFIKQELERIYISNHLTNPDIKIDNYINNKDKFCTFPELNNLKLDISLDIDLKDEEPIKYEFNGTLQEHLKYLKDQFGDDETIQISNNFKYKILKAFAEKLIDLHTEELIKELTRVGSISKINNNNSDIYSLSKLTSGKKELTKDDIKSLATNYTVNTIGLTQLVDSNMAFYKSPLDFFKRNKQAISPKYSYGVASNELGETILQQKCIIAKDELITSNSINEIAEVMNNAAKAGKLTKEEANEIIDSYKNITRADGQSFRSISSYVKLMKMEGNPNYSKFKAAAKRILSNNWTRDDYFLILQCIKPFMVTQNKVQVNYTDENNKVNTTTLLVPIQQKNSEVVLFMGMLIASNTAAGSKLKGINDFMEKYDIDTFMFESCVKVGGMDKIDLSKFNNINSEKEVFKALEDKYIVNGLANPDVVNYIDINDFGMQTPTPPSIFDEKMALGIQVRKVLMRQLSDDLSISLDNSKTSYNKQEIMNLFQQAICQNTNAAMNEYLKILNDPEKLSNLLIEQLNSSDLYDADLKLYCSVRRDENNQLDLTSPLYDPIQSYRIQSMLLSALRKRVLKQSFSGGDCIAMTNYGKTEELNVRFKDSQGNLIKTKSEFAKDNKNLSEKELDKAFEDYEKEAKKDANFAYMEVYFPCYSKEMQEALLDKDSSGRSFINIDKLNNRGEKIFSEELRYIMGYRTPTEDKYSIIPMKIVGFLPVCAGSSIMLPDEMEVSTGGDYDGDKFYMILNESKKEIHTDKNKKGEEIESIKFNKIHYDFSKPMSKNSILARANLINEIQFKILTSKEVSYMCLKNGNFNTLKHDGFILDIVNKLTLNNSLYEKINIEDELKEKIQIFRDLLKDSTNILNEKDIIIYNKALNNLENSFSESSVDDYTTLSSNFFNTLNSYDLKTIKKLHDKLSSFSEPCTLNSLVTIMEQNKSGKNMISRVAVFNTLAANLNWTHALLQQPVLVKYLNNNHISGYSTLFNNIDGNTGLSTFKILAEMQAASVDNAKDPVLGYFNLIGNNTGIALMMSKLGIKPHIMGLFLNQPIIKELTKIAGSEELQDLLFKNIQKKNINNRSMNNIIDSLKQLYINKLKVYIDKLNGENKKEFINRLNAEAILDEKNLSKDLFNSNDAVGIINQIDYLNLYKRLLNPSQLLTTIALQTRTDKETPANFMEILNNRDAVYNMNNTLSALNKDGLLSCPIVDMRIVKDKKDENLEKNEFIPLKLIDNQEVNFEKDMSVFERYKFNDPYKTDIPIPYLQSYYQDVNITFANSIEKYFPFLKNDFLNTIKTLLYKRLDESINPNTYDTNFYRSFVNEFITFYMTNSKCFDSLLGLEETKEIDGKEINSLTNKVANRNKFVINFPNYFKQLQHQKDENKIYKYPELQNLSFFKYFSVDTPTNNFSKNKNTKRSFPILDFKGSNITNKQVTQQFKEDWRSLLYSDKPELRNLAKQLFVYGFLVHGLNFTSKNILMFAPPIIYNVLPGYAATMKSIKDVLNDSTKYKDILSRFLFQYNINNPKVSFFNKMLRSPNFSGDIETMIKLGNNSPLNASNKDFFKTVTINNKTFYTIDLNNFAQSDKENNVSNIIKNYIKYLTDKSQEEGEEPLTFTEKDQEELNKELETIFFTINAINENPPLSYVKLTTKRKVNNKSYYSDYLLYKDSNDLNSTIFMLPLNNSYSEYANNYNIHQSNLEFYISDTALTSLNLGDSGKFIKLAANYIINGSKKLSTFNNSKAEIVPFIRAFKTSSYQGDINTVINLLKNEQTIEDNKFKYKDTDKIKEISLQDLAKVDFRKFFLQRDNRDIYVIKPEDYLKDPDTFNNSFKTVYDNLFKTYLNYNDNKTLIGLQLADKNEADEIKKSKLNSQLSRIVFPEFLARAFKNYKDSKSDANLLEGNYADPLAKNNNTDEVFTQEIMEENSDQIENIQKEKQKRDSYMNVQYISMENMEKLINQLRESEGCC